MTQLLFLLSVLCSYSLASILLFQPFVMPELLGVEYDSAESVYSSDEEDEEELIGASS